MTTRGLGTRRRRILTAALTAAVLGGSGLATAGSPATAAPDDNCGITAVPDDDLTVGQPVNGLTVARGTTPEAFTGEVEGVLTDGIAPGVDMILATLASAAIEKNGVWSGMSGSPVYADPERTQLIGAVSYTLTEGKTALAGITPAAAMFAVGPDGTAEEAPLTTRLTQRLASAGTATRTQLSSGMRALPSPLAISGLSERRFGQLAGWWDDHGPVTRAAGGSGATAAVGEEVIVRGGNVAASLGYGYVTAAATGTVTAVCDGGVLAFGHPVDYVGEDAGYLLHPADAVTVVPGGTFSGFKVANLGDPVGEFTNDRMAGLLGALGQLPATYDVTSTARSGARTATGTTAVASPDVVLDAALANSAAASDRALDRAGKGSAKASWTIKGKRRDGRDFTLRRSDVYASSDDVVAAPLSALAMQALALLENETEAVTITEVSTDTTLSRDDTRWRIGRTYQRSGTGWKRITGTAPAVLKAGRTVPIRVELYSRTKNPRFEIVNVTAGKASINRTGRLTLRGGFQGEDEFFESSELFWEEYEEEVLGGEYGTTIDETLKQLNAQPKNDSVSTSFAVRGTPTKKGSFSLGQVVSGSAVVPVRVTR